MHQCPSFSISLHLVSMAETGMHHVRDTSAQVSKDYDNDQKSENNAIITNAEVSNEKDKEINDNTVDNTMTSETSKKLVRRTRLIKFVNTIIFIIVFIIIVFIIPTLSEDTTGYHLAAYVISLNYLIGLFYFLSILFGSNHLHKIYVKRRHIEGYNNLVVPQCTIEDKNHTIKSVSALTATFGSNIHGLFSRAAYASVGAAFSAIIIHANENKDSISSKETIASILMVIGVFGNGLYGTWELEGPNNYMSTFCHYSCSPLIFILQTLAYAIKQEWDPLSISLFTIGLILDIFYVTILYRLPETSKDLKEVHRISFMCIISELAALIIPCFSVVAFIYTLK